MSINSQTDSDFLSCVLPTDQSRVLDEVHQPGLEFEEDAFEEAERRVRSQNQRRDQVGIRSFPLVSPSFYSFFTTHLRSQFLGAIADFCVFFLLQPAR